MSTNVTKKPVKLTQTIAMPVNEWLVIRKSRPNDYLALLLYCRAVLNQAQADAKRNLFHHSLNSGAYHHLLPLPQSRILGTILSARLNDRDK
jgi:hypothetical protein